MVYTRITADHQSHEMWLYVMDNSNNAMRFVPYSYQQWNSKTRAWEERGVRAAFFFCLAEKPVSCKKMGLICCCEEQDVSVMDGVRIPMEWTAALLKWDVVGEEFVPGVFVEGDIA